MLERITDLATVLGPMYSILISRIMGPFGAPVGDCVSGAPTTFLFFLPPDGTEFSGAGAVWSGAAAASGGVISETGAAFVSAGAAGCAGVALVSAGVAGWAGAALVA